MSTAAGTDGPPRRPTVFPTHRGRRTRAVIDHAARMILARKGIPATTVTDIAAEACRSAASFYNYDDPKEAMVCRWNLRFRDKTNAYYRASYSRGGPSN
jgi:AcrR family transcriptional regulator